MNGKQVVVMGELIGLDGLMVIRDAEGTRWSFAPDRHSRPFMGSAVILRGEVIAPGRLNVLEIRRLDTCFPG